MNRFRLALASLLTLIAGDALAQGSPSQCARTPTYLGCYPASTSIPRTAMLPLALGDTQRTVSVGSLLSKMLASDVTAALGFTPQSTASAIVSGAVDASGNLILKRADGTTLPPIAGFSAGGGTGGSGGASTGTLLSALSAAGIVVPHLQFTIDASLPATVGSTPAAGFNTDSAGNIVAYADPRGMLFGHGYGQAQLVSGGAGGFPIIRNNTVTNINNGYDALQLSASGLAEGGVADQMFGQAGEAYYCAAVIKQTAAGGNEFFRAYSAGGVHVNVLQPGGDGGDGTYRIEQNNGGASASEAATSGLIGKMQVLEWGADGNVNYLFRNGANTVTTQADASHIGGFGSGGTTNLQVLNNSKTDTSALMCASGFPSRSLRGQLIAAMASRYGISGVITPTVGPSVAVEPLTSGSGSTSPPVADNSLHRQAYIQPTVIPTSSAVPVGVTLTNPNSNIFDATFAAGGTAGTNAQLDKMFYFTNNEGDFVNNPASYPSQGAAGNWESVYRHYPATLPDGTPDPANLHDLSSGDHLSCIARTRIATSFDSSRWEQCYLRATVSMKPGRYAELRARWPSPKREGISARWAWPVFWGFSVHQPFGTTNITNPQPSREIDVFDGYPYDNRRPGSSIASGTPTTAYTGDLSIYSGSTDQSGAPGFNFADYFGEPDGGGRLYGDPGAANDPTDDYHTWGWYLAPNGADLYILYDGKILRHRYVPHLAVTTDGQPIEYRIEVSNQYVTKFNNDDHAAAIANDDAAHPMRSSYDIKYLRVWDSTVTLPAYVPYTAPALAGANPAVINGTTFSFNPSTPTSSQHISGSGTASDPVLFTMPSAGNNDVRTYLGTPWNGLGSRTIRMRPEMPPQNSFQSVFGVWNSSATANQYVGLLNLYTRGYGAFSGLANQKDDGSTQFYNPPGLNDNVRTMAELGNFLPYCARVVGTASSYQYAVSRTCAANTWFVLGTVPKSDVQGGTPDRVGVYIRSQDEQGYNRPVSIELSGYAANDNTDIQAAAGF